MGLSCLSKPVQEPLPPDAVSLLRGSTKSSDDHPPTPPREQKGWVHQYRKLHVLGRGSAAKVRLCVRADGERFAMKIFNKSLLRRRRHWDCDAGRYADGFEDVLREVALMKKLSHRNLVRLHEVIDHPEKDKLYLILDHVPGGPLMSAARTQTPLAEEKARGYLRDVVQGLAYLHLHNIAHQDLKPENILLAADGHAMIADFGVARMMRPPQSREQAERSELSLEIETLRGLLSTLASTSDGADGTDGAGRSSGNSDNYNHNHNHNHNGGSTPAGAAGVDALSPLGSGCGGSGSPAELRRQQQARAVAQARRMLKRPSARLLESSDGTPAFRAPETFRSGSHCGRCADVWSLGVTTYVMLCGTLPFQPDEAQQPRLSAATSYSSATGRSFAGSGTTVSGGSGAGSRWVGGSGACVGGGGGGGSEAELASLERAVCEAELRVPPEVSAEAAQLLHRMLRKEPAQRIDLAGVAAHPWVTRGGAAPLRLDEARVQLLSESDVSDAVVELRGLELDLAGDERSASHGLEAGGLSSKLRRFRSEAWTGAWSAEVAARAPLNLHQQHFSRPDTCTSRSDGTGTEVSSSG